MNNPTFFKRSLVLTFFACLLFTKPICAQVPGIAIEGPLVVCNYECVNYTVTGIEALPPGSVTYQWTATAQGFGGGNLDYEVFINNDNTVEICWNVSDLSSHGVILTGHLGLNIFVNGIHLHTQTILVRIGRLSAGAQFISGEHCPIDIYGCIEVCEGSVVKYSIFPSSAAHAVIWEVIGSDDYIVNEDGTLTVRWGHSGSGQIRAGYALSQCLATPQGVECMVVASKPVTNFVSDPPPSQDGVLRICKGQEVRFANQTEHAERFHWLLGNEISTQPNPSVTYDTPGTYEVTLLAYNQCNCRDTSKMTVIVEDTFTPSIDCKSTVCVGESATYQTDANCGSFFWTVNELGTVTAGGGVNDNFVTVDWLQGGTGIVELAVDGCPGITTICESSTITEIPIISNDIQIEGRSRVCLNKEESYSLPGFTGTAISWITPGGAILAGHGTNEIIVRWPALQSPTQRRVIVNYNNCYLGCGGSDTLNVFVLPEFKITGDPEVCAGSSSSHSVLSGDDLVECNWTATAADGSIVWSSAAPAASVNIDWPLSGTYILKAIPVNLNDYCQDESTRRIVVIDAPAAPGSILGPAQICIGETYFYRADGVEQGASLHWRINNGGTITEVSGATASVLWGASPPYEVSLRQAGIAGGCVSEATTLTASVLTALPVLEGSATACVGSAFTYTVVGLANGNFQWTILPQGAGVVISNPNNASVQVQWNRSGPATLQFEFCNVSATFPVVVEPTVPPVVTAPAMLCAGETAMVQTTLPFAAYAWKTEDGSTASTEATPELPAGFYSVEVTNDLGCTSAVVFDIAELPAPDVRISSASLRCLNLGNPQLHALNTVTGYEFEWMHNNVLTGQTTPVITATQAGVYRVQVTDINGCRSNSNILSVVANCSSGGGSGGLPPGASLCLTSDLDFQITPTGACNVRNYTAMGNNIVPGSVQWRFGDPASGSANNMATGINATHTFSDAGFYEILMLADVNQGGTVSSCGILFIDTVWTKANFAYTQACAGDEVLFTDRATFIPSISISDWQWDFGDPASGAANSSTESNPTHTFSAPGDYAVTLTVTSSTGCTSTHSKVITIFGPPEIDMNLPLAFCEKTPYLFTASADNPPAIWVWNFDAGAGNDIFNANDIYHAYETSGSYQIELEATSPYGCLGSITETITVGTDDHILTGNIESSLEIPFCLGDTTVLSAPAGGTAWLWTEGNTSAAINAWEAGAYFVAITDSQGCRYVPPPAFVNLLEAPIANIRAAEYSEDLEVTGYVYHALEICEGEDIYLEAVTSTEYPVEWSNGLTTRTIEFTALRNSLLAAGTHEISLTVTDTTSGCTSMVDFTVTVHPKPTVPTLAPAPTNLCEGTPATFYLINRDPEFLYVWNTGQTSDSIVVSTVGNYFVQAFNAFNCASESDTRRIIPGLNMAPVPTGCYSQCRPDTICVANIPGASAYQWFLNGEPIAGATTPSLIATESGSYHLMATRQSSSCLSVSEPLVLDLYDGTSPITGQVYFDVNGNNIIDAADTLMTNIGIVLTDTSGTTETSTSGMAGDFEFLDQGAGMYNLNIDTALLNDYQVLNDPVSLSHSGCDPQHANLLIGAACPTVFSMTELVICEGTSITYEGVTAQSDTTFTLQYTAFNGCDSIEIVTVMALSTSMTALTFQSCEGETFDYNGNALLPGTTTDFVYANAAGCDSMVTVTVTALQTSASSLSFQVCEGESFEYQGTVLQGGSTTEFILTNAAGCDSVVTVAVATLPTSATALTFQSCEGEAVDYNGNALLLGTITDFVYPNSLGCDSVVTVTVTAIPTSVMVLTLQTCPGESLSYNGTLILAGTTMDFVFTNAQGCDSTVTVTVEAFEISTITIALSACAGETALYNGTTIPAGESETFTFLAASGCDSLVTVSVAENELPDFEVETNASCAQVPTGSLTATAISNGQAPYEYSLDALNYSATPVFSALEAGDYTVSIRDANGCQNTVEASISELAPLILVLDTAQVLPCNPQELRLEPELVSGNLGTLIYQWSTGETSPDILIGAAGSYSVSVSNACETQVKTISISPAVAAGSDLFYIPNVFSPNGDGINDRFEILPAEEVIVESFQLMIFDRWGNFVFSSSDIGTGWNGEFRGRPITTGVLVWTLKAQLRLCGELKTIERKGDVTLLR